MIATPAPRLAETHAETTRTRVSAKKSPSTIPRPTGRRVSRYMCALLSQISHRTFACLHAHQRAAQSCRQCAHSGGARFTFMKECSSSHSLERSPELLSKHLRRLQRETASVPASDAAAAAVTTPPPPPPSPPPPSSTPSSPHVAIHAAICRAHTSPSTDGVPTASAAAAAAESTADAVATPDVATALSAAAAALSLRIRMNMYLL